MIEVEIELSTVYNFTFELSHPSQLTFYYLFVFVFVEWKLIKSSSQHQIRKYVIFTIEGTIDHH